MIFANINIKSLLKPIKVVLFASLLSVSISQNLSAKEIICGNTKCDIETRKCIKLPQKACVEYSYYSSYYGGGSQCIKYEYYRCVGKNEEQYKANKEINVSTNDNGEVLTGENETIALRKAKTAAYTAGERMEIAEEHYSEVQSKDMSKTAERILVKTEATEKEREALGENDTKDLRKAIEKLASYTTIKGYTEGKGSPGDTNIKDAMDDAIAELNELKEDGHITEDNYNRLKSEIGELYNVASQNLEAVAEKMGDKELAEKQRQERIAVRDEVMQKCATSAQLKARYNAGCWSCLVLERLTSAFLHAANKGLPVVQKAGITLLLLGSGLWIMFWALKSVSSFTQVQTANILNDLFKFLFKVCLAYVFITLSTTAISQYFIRPIMSVGAIIGQQFWHEKVALYTEDWEELTDEDYAEVDKVVENIMSQVPTKSSKQETVINGGAGNDLTPEEIADNEEANKENDANFAKTAIPNLLIPGVQGGVISSGAGCRPKSATGGKGSTCHRGVDVGGLNKGSECIPYIAAGPGQLYYTELGGYGRVALINHGKVGDYYWVTSYNHMSSATETLKIKNSLRSGMSIKQGVPIGCTGGSGGKRDASGKVQITESGFDKHVHFEVFASKQNPGGGWPSGKQVDPLALLGREVVFLNDICNQCNGNNRVVSKAAESFLKSEKKPPCEIGTENWTCRIPVGNGWAAAGEAIQNVNSSVDVGGSYSGDYNYDSLVVDIPQEIKYTGPTNIMPKSIMNSILGAMRAITNTTADNMVLGNMVMCYAGLKNGGAWKIEIFDIDIAHVLNIFLWLEGAIIWALGFMLTLAVSYYFIDISFKIGFAVLAIPVVFGIWPFGFGQDKLFKAISIIAKSSATFAFLAITTKFGMDLVSEALNGVDDIYAKIDAFATETVTENQEDLFKAEIDNTLYLFSPTFIMMAFAIIYFYKMVQGTISDLVNKFFPDNVFGDSSPMHSAATMMTSFAHKMAMKVTGADLAKDIVAHQTGRLVKGGLTKAKDGVVGGLKAAAHPVRTGKQAYNAAKKLGKKISSAFGKKK